MNKEQRKFFQKKKAEEGGRQYQGIYMTKNKKKLAVYCFVFFPFSKTKKKKEKEKNFTKKKRKEKKENFEIDWNYSLKIMKNKFFIIAILMN